MYSIIISSLYCQNSNSVLFASNGFFQRHLLSPQIPHSSQLDRVALAGSLSGVVMSGVNCPVELLKVRLQVQDHNNRVRNLYCLLTAHRMLLRNIKIYLIVRLKLFDLMEFSVYIGE